MPAFEQQRSPTQSSHLVSSAKANRAAPRPTHAENPLLAQQQALGNQVMQHLLRSGVLQARLKTGHPGDKYEQEADRVADEVMQAQDDPRGLLTLQQGLVNASPDRPPVLPQLNSATQAVVRLKPNPRTLAVPKWHQLPAYARADLAPRGYNQSWFNQKSDALRLTMLNLYVKLKGMNLWRFVGREASTGLGRLEFLSPNVGAFKSTLRSRDDFTSPERSPAKWSSREMRATGSLHFKHFKNWPRTKVQAHIDKAGLLLRSKAWWLIPIIPLGQMGRHAWDWATEGYQDVFGIRSILLKQGWDPRPLRVARPTPVRRKALLGNDMAETHDLPKLIGHAGRGQPLDRATLNFMQDRLGYDLSQVRVHVDAAAAQAARQLNAQAFTVGRDIFFGPERYQPHTVGGRRLLAHELVHVIQHGG